MNRVHGETEGLKSALLSELAGLYDVQVPRKQLCRQNW
jgi:hypothetical protein